MQLNRRNALWAGLPVLILAAVGVVLPFAWRSAGLVGPCLHGSDCAVQDLLDDPSYLRALWSTVWLSAVSTGIGLGIGLGAAVALAQMPRWRGAVTVLAGLGSNFSGVPLAVAMTLLFGAEGVVTLGLAPLGLALPFDLYRNSGLLVAYICFQVPLACLLLMAPVQMLEAGLIEAAATLGAGPLRFWRRVGLPLLAPSLVETGSLLFANAAAAYATPFALSGTGANVLAVRIASLVSGDIFAQPELSSLLALIMFAMLVLVIVAARRLASRLRGRW